MQSIRFTASNALRSIISAGLGKRGWELIRGWEIESLRNAKLKSELLSRHFDEKLPLLLEQRSVDCLLDVGANEGQFARTARTACGYRGRLVSYEPIPRLVAHLRRESSDDPMWDIVEKALGSSNSESVLNEMQSSVFSSLHTPLGAMPSQFDVMNTVVDSYPVTVSTVESEIERLQREEGCESFFLKIDTQGHDLEVLRGIRGQRGRVAGVMCEMSFVPLYEAAPRWIETARFLEEAGFSIVSIDPISWDYSNLRLVEADCLFVST